MKNLRRMFPIAMLTTALLLTGCTADELQTRGDGNDQPSIVETTESGTVIFANNTSMTIGNGHALTKGAPLTRGAVIKLEENGACSLEFESVEVSADATRYEETSYDKDGTVKDIGDISGKDVIIASDVESRIGVLNYEFSRTLNNTVFVYGTFSLNNAQTTNDGGRIVVYDGGVLNCNMSSLKGIDIICYKGGTVNFPDDGITIDANSEVLIDGDMNLVDGDMGSDEGYLTVNGKLYVGGDLTCQRITSETAGAQTHVIGAVNVEGRLGQSGHALDELTGRATIRGAAMCVEGAMSVFSLTASAGAKVHIDCKLVATDNQNSSINITNGAILWTSYVETQRIHVSGGSYGEKAYVYLSDDGIINASMLTLGKNSWIAPYQTDYSALVSAWTVTLEDKVIWEDCIDPNLYVNYNGVIPVEGEPEDQSKRDICTINTGTAECSPGFTVDEGEDPEPEPEPEPDPEPTPEPGEGDIILQVPNLVDDYTLLADDFAIRVNGDYMENIVVNGNEASLGAIQIKDNKLTITVAGLSEETILLGNDYTYEVWLWVDNTNPELEPGTGAKLPLFTNDMYKDWIGYRGGLPLPAGTETGMDFTKEITVANGRVTSPRGFEVRYNVYRGLSGKVDKDTGFGDTPYIKVSIHVQRNDKAPENTAVGVYPTDE